MTPIIRATVMGVGWCSAVGVTQRMTSNTQILGCDLGFRTFRPGRKPYNTPQ
jgi:hypothetical protein